MHPVGIVHILERDFEIAAVLLEGIAELTWTDRQLPQHTLTLLSSELFRLRQCERACQFDEEEEKSVLLYVEEEIRDVRQRTLLLVPSDARLPILRQ